MADLHYTRDDYAASASQTATVTLAGETSAAPLVADMTIEVPMANLDSMLSWAGAYVSELKDNVLVKTYPTVNLNTPGLAVAAESFDTEFRSVDGDALSSTGNTTVATLQGMFKNLPWVYASKVFEDADLPIEAVIKVDNGALTATPIADVFGPADSSNLAGSHPVDLFEQCLAAGKIPAGVLNDKDGNGNPSFEVGDSISLYVTYTLTKTRQFEVDSDVHSGSATITVGNKTINAGTPASEVANAVTKVVRWKFTKSAPPS